VVVLAGWKGAPQMMTEEEFVVLRDFVGSDADRGVGKATVSG